MPDLLVTAIPSKGYDVRQYGLRGTKGKVSTIVAGDRVDLGDRTFEVLHLPGHSPGSIALWDEASGVLFSGDAVYDGLLIDNLPGGNRTAYVATLKRLLDMPVSMVHAGHEPSFGRDRLREIVRAYLASWDV